MVGSDQQLGIKMGDDEVKTALLLVKERTEEPKKETGQRCAR